jgi:hypothetical protein
MFVCVPRNWGDVVSPRRGIAVSSDYSTDSVRSALLQGEALFLIGADALSHSNGWLLAEDHLALFGTGSLAGPNHHETGPRFPNLRGMYLIPEISGKSVQTGTVMQVPDICFSTGAELEAFHCDALVSGGLDLAIAAAHGGARVVFALNCRKPGDNGNNSLSFLNNLIQGIEGGEE